MMSPKIFSSKSPLTGLFFLLLSSGLIGQEKILTSSPGQDRHPWWSPDGESLVFESDRDGDWELFIIDKNGKNERRLTNNSFNDRNPSWHPDGRSILFESDESGDTRLYRLDIHDLSTQLIHLEDFKYSPTTARYSPDGRQIAFCANTGGENLQLNLFLTSQNGGQVKQLTYDSTRSFYPAWSPDGIKLVFFSRRDTRGKQDELYIMQTSRPKAARRITTYPLHDFCPHWSPDGGKLVFSSSIANDRPDLFMSNTDGRNIRQLTFTPGLGETQAVWSPDGSRIAYAGFRKGSYEICILTVEH